MKEVVYFTNLKVVNPSNYYKRQVSKSIHNALSQQNVMTYSKKIKVEIDNLICHKNHPLGKSELLSQKIDHRLSSKISEFVKQGVSNVREMKRILKLTVDEMFGEKSLPTPNNRRFYPRNDIIRAHIVMECKKLGFSNIDQECLESKIKEWKNRDDSLNIHFEPKVSEHQDEFLFVYQAGWQKKLLNKYGNEMIFLDATYKTTRYSLPLFFLVVKTNVDFQIVATFVSENETFESIKKALNVIKYWNIDLKPLYCMTDYCNEEIRAVETVFIGCEVFICDFHREQAWDRWLKKIANGCYSRKDEILTILRGLAWSKTCEEEIKATQVLEFSEFWKLESFSKLKHYIETYWLPIKKKWICCYRQNRLLISCNTNNGVERQNASFKYSYLKRYNSSSLTGMLTLLTEEFFTDKLESYTDFNFKMDARYRRYACWVPKYLYNRPHSFVKHCLKRKSTADCMDLNKVVMIKSGIFSVSSTFDTSVQYFISFGDEISMPKCTCVDWLSTAYLCKHFFVVFRKYPAWSWNALSVLYRNSPYLNIDSENYEIEHEKTAFNSFKALLPLIQEQTVIVNQKQSYKNTQPIYSGVDVREMLNTVKNLSFEFDENSFEIMLLHKTLSSLIEKLNKGRVKESGIAVRRLNDKSSNSLKKHIQIPIRKPIKLPFKRVGSRKDEAIAASKIFITEEVYSTDTFKLEIVEKSIDNNRLMEEQVIFLSDNDEECFEANVVYKTNLSAEDLNDIKTNQMLSDTVIHSVQNMISGVSGLQDPVLGQNLSFHAIKESFVQVLHNGDAHWLTVSTFWCSDGEVCLLDSMFHGKVKNHVIRQICAIMQCTKDILTVRVLPVQQQANSIDCGLFALAFAKHIAFTGLNPCYIGFADVDMRKHLLQSISGNHLNEFPKTSKKTMFCKEKKFKFNLYCICRQVWTVSDKFIKDRHMVQCEKCECWFHRACENIPEYVLAHESAEWLCSKGF
ncbi:uncharacterized protein LOC124806293 [Hydra vulgaris]|uniref:uncharacterized protein LOC124806293 n=1 Tax=Hydra vulgaris TaxID=6087 RepID=UPI0032EA6E77